MDHQWIFEEEERRDILVGIHLLATVLDEERRKEYRENAKQYADDWDRKFAVAQYMHNWENRERP